MYSIVIFVLPFVIIIYKRFTAFMLSLHASLRINIEFLAYQNEFVEHHIINPLIHGGINDPIYSLRNFQSCITEVLIASDKGGENPS